MPTMGRLAGAVCFGLLAGILAVLSIPVFGDGGPPSFWFPLCGVVGVMTGWMLVGSRVGQGTGPAIGTGISGAACIAFWVLLVLSGEEMIRRSMRGRYDGPMDAVVSLFGVMVDYGAQFNVPLILMVWLGGGVVAGLLTDAIGKRYR